MQNHRGTHKNISQLPKKEKILIPMILNARMYQKWEEKKNVVLLVEMSKKWNNWSYALAMPIMIFIRASQVSTPRCRMAPWSHCSKFPLFTYSYTSILNGTCIMSDNKIIYTLISSVYTHFTFLGQHATPLLWELAPSYKWFGNC